MGDSPLRFVAARVLPGGAAVGAPPPPSAAPFPGAAGVWVGQSLAAAVTVTNASPAPLRAVAVRVDVLVGGAHRAVVAEPPPATVLGPGHAVECGTAPHAVREAGPHSLVVSAAFTTPDGERRFASQAFPFAAAVPLAVRTKVRPAGGALLVEATLENATREAMEVDAIELVPAAPGAYEVRAVGPPPVAAAAGPLARAPLARLSVGGAHSFVFRLTAVGGEGAPLPPVAPTLGHLDIRWRAPSGDAARLQTAAIAAPAAPPAREVALALAPLPRPLVAERPFVATVVVRNATDRATGPLRLSLSPGALPPGAAREPPSPRSPLAAGLAAAATAAPPPPPRAPPTVVAAGPHAVEVPAVPPRGEAAVGLALLPLAAGPAALEGLLLTDGEGRVFDALPPVELLVEAAGG